MGVFIEYQDFDLSHWQYVWILELRDSGFGDMDIADITGLELRIVTKVK